MKPKLLTKSKYILGLSCPVCFWKAMHKEEEKYDENLEFRFMQGQIVGEKAKELFPYGVSIPTEDFLANIKQTKELLARRVPLFEAGFMFEDCFSRADILLPAQEEMWDIIEVKSSTKVKDEHIHDLAFQKYCYEGCGIKVHRCFVYHINNKYVKDGKIDVEKFFVKTDVTKEVLAAEKDVPKNVKTLFEIAAMKSPPEMNLCYDKEDILCSNEEHDCWHLSERNVFELDRGGRTSFDLHNEGYKLLKEIPESYENDLSTKQKIQVECAKSGNEFISKDAIRFFVTKLEYPLSFLDFETYSTAIPIYDGLKPYGRIPFQFSLHVTDKEDGKTEHKSFLAEGKDDPRKDFLKALKSELPEKGSILVYNLQFERSVLEELGEKFPEFKPWLSKVLPRLVDLIIPFKNYSYYNPKQAGSTSIKYVLPAITGISYKDLDIGEGELASIKYFYSVHGYPNGQMPSKSDIAKIRKDLLIYCGLDTEGMIKILDKLKEIVK